VSTNRKYVAAVLDDDNRVTESLEELLESAGYAARVFSSGQALLADAHLSEIDVLITDIGMPIMDGFEVQRLVGVQRPDMPVILLTGRHELAEQAQARHATCFRKPFDGQALLAAIGEALTGKESQS
jgi:FixJ family two-component response regulator